ncbi:MAG: hypothetical protein KKD07_02135, partial [Candidatus Omnitrophica bacterium]|nr:hypothetical protein [Candidatus Omnitrophota bacterium]
MEKFIIKLLITILCVLIVFCMPVSADENDLEFQTSHLPVIEGFKVTADMPVSWEKGKVIAPKKEEFQFDYSFIYGEAPDEKYQVTRTWDCRHCPVSPRKDACDVCLGIILFEDPISFDKFAEGVKDHYNPKIYHTFDQGFNDKLGPKTFFQNVAYMKTSYGGKKVPPDSPDTTILKYLFQNRLLLSLSYRAIKPENYEQFLPVFEEIVKTVKVTKVNDSDIGINRYYFSPKVNIYAEEPNITLEGSFALVLPSGWTSKEVVTDSAALSLPSEWKSSNENGKLSIEFTPLAEGVEGESESKLIINIEGVEKQYYGDNFYFDVGDNYVSSIIP